MELEKSIFQRTELLVGNVLMDRIASTRVIIFGVGGVGSWCAESLVRSGIMHITIVDSDRVCASNINRQLMATTKTVGMVKVDVLKERLLEINPAAQITALQQIYCAETSDSFQLDSYDYIIVAIDSLENKADLIRTATKTSAVLFSSMGAALKMNPLKIDVAEFWKVKGCRLGASLRKKMVKGGEKPAKKFLCVYSEELLENRGADLSFEEAGVPLPDASQSETDSFPEDIDWHTKKVHVNGTMAHTTAMFGFTLAGLVMQDICKE